MPQQLCEGHRNHQFDHAVCFLLSIMHESCSALIWYDDFELPNPKLGGRAADGWSQRGETHLNTSGSAPGESPSNAVHPEGGGSAGRPAGKPPLMAGGSGGGSWPPPPPLPSLPGPEEALKKSGTGGRGDRGLRGTTGGST